jgi:hypothetical protein
MEGLNLSLVLSGSTLIAVATLAVKVWQSSRAQRIGPQPFMVAPAPASTPQGQCNERHAAIEQDHSNLFHRMSAVEQRVAAVEASHRALETRLESMDKKLDALLRKG